MKKLFTLLMVSAAFSSNAQTQVYATGQTYGDDWTGWTTPVTSGVSNDMFSANTWTFSLSGGTYSIETTRAFAINSQDIDIYWAASTQDSDIEVLHSTDGSTWSPVQSLNYGTGFQQQTIVIPTFNPSQENFYLKLKMTGTAGSPPSAIYNSMYINADLSNPFTGGGANVEEYELAANVIYSGGLVQIITALQGFTVNIYNIQGKLIKTDINLKNFDLSSYKAGVYLVNVLSEDGKAKTFKISHL